MYPSKKLYLTTFTLPSLSHARSRKIICKTDYILEVGRTQNVDVEPNYEAYNQTRTQTKLVLCPPQSQTQLSVFLSNSNRTKNIYIINKFILYAVDV